jgi:Uma2 family endonuclease
MTSLATSNTLQSSNGVSVQPVSSPRLISLEDFRRRYSHRDNGYKYEFINGVILKTKRNMNVKQYHIVKNLTRRFTQTSEYAKGTELGIEVEQFTDKEQMRRPDLCLIPAQKLQNNDETISGFVIEIISPTDRANDINSKCREYFRAGVQVFWQIHPVTESVSVFTSPTQVTICEGTTICSAAPAVPDFEMTAEEIFRK